MSDELADLYVTLRANMKGFDDSLASSEGRAAGFESSTSGHFGGVFKAVLGLATAIGGVQIFKSMYDEAIEAQKVMAQTNAVLASTGGAAGISASGVGDLATSLSNLVGIDDETIQAGENILLTFTNIKNGVGAGNDIFNQATKASLDLSTAMHEDLQSASVQVGKALNDPIQGVTALRRVGVQLSDQQVDLVKHLVATGDTLGAQKVILGELNKEFGGSAEAAATPMERLGVVVKNLEETIGTALLPVIATAAGWLADVLPTGLELASTFFGNLEEAVNSFVGAFLAGDGDITSSGFNAYMEEAGNIARNMWDDISSAAQSAWAVLQPIVVTIAGYFEDHWKPILIAVAGAFALIAGSAAIGAVVAAIGGLVAVLASPIVLIAALVAGLIYAYEESTTFRNIVDGVASWLRDNVPPAFEAVRHAAEVAFQWIVDNVVPWVVTVAQNIATQFQTLSAAVSERWNDIRDAISNVLTAIETIVGLALAPILLAWSAFHDQIMSVVVAAWSFVQGIIQAAVEFVTGFIDIALGLLSGDWGRAWDGIVEIFRSSWDMVSAILTYAWAIVTNLLSVGLQALSGLWSFAWAAMTGMLSDAWNSIVWAVSSGITAVVGFFMGLPGQILGAVASLPGLLVSTGAALVQGLIDAAFMTAGQLWSWLSGMPGFILGAIGDLGGVLWDAGVKLIQGFIGGIGSMIGSIKDTLGSITSSLTSWKGPPSVDAALLYGSGQLVIGGFINGLESRYSDVHRSLAGLTAGVGATSMPGIAGQFTSGAGLAGSGRSVVEHRVTVSVEHEGEIHMTGSVTDTRALAKQIARPVRDALLDLQQDLPNLWGEKG